jgi:hypothetical protein
MIQKSGHDDDSLEYTVIPSQSVQNQQSNKTNWCLGQSIEQYDPNGNHGYHSDAPKKIHCF